MSAPLSLQLVMLAIMIECVLAHFSLIVDFSGAFQHNIRKRSNFGIDDFVVVAFFTSPHSRPLIVKNNHKN